MSTSIRVITECNIAIIAIHQTDSSDTVIDSYMYAGRIIFGLLVSDNIKILLGKSDAVIDYVDCQYTAGIGI